MFPHVIVVTVYFSIQSIHFIIHVVISIMFVLTDYLKFLKMNFPASEEKERVAVKREETQEKSVSKVLSM